MCITAIRETFEERGALVSTGSLRHLSGDEFERGRRTVYGDASQFQTLLSEWQLKLDFTSLHPWARFIGPKRAKRLFDTMFYLKFVSLNDANKFRFHDDHETVDTMWYSPVSLSAVPYALL